MRRRTRKVAAVRLADQQVRFAADLRVDEFPKRRKQVADRSHLAHRPSPHARQIRAPPPTA